MSNAAPAISWSDMDEQEELALLQELVADAVASLERTGVARDVDPAIMARLRAAVRR